MKEAMFYKQLEDFKVLCQLCPHYCVIKSDDYGKCQVRKNVNGKLMSMNYGKITAKAYDPIEKKPLYHFYPGQEILSVSSFGCNMTCTFCQNYRLSQFQYNLESTSVESLISEIDGLGIAFTYNEPIVCYEYIYDVAVRIKQDFPEKKVILITNGYINKTPLEALLPYLDAVNVDLKNYSDEFYTAICGGSLEPVLEAIQLFSSIHMEVTTLMVTDYVDVQMVELISQFLNQIDPNIPLHLSRYFPNYLMQINATDLKTMHQAYKLSKNYLNHVYLGNVQDINNNTVCSNCQAVLIERHAYDTTLKVSSDTCPNCGMKHGIIWLEGKAEHGNS